MQTTPAIMQRIAIWFIPLSHGKALIYNDLIHLFHLLLFNTAAALGRQGRSGYSSVNIYISYIKDYVRSTI